MSGNKPELSKKEERIAILLERIRSDLHTPEDLDELEALTEGEIEHIDMTGGAARPED